MTKYKKTWQDKPSSYCRCQSAKQRDLIRQINHSKISLTCQKFHECLEQAIRFFHSILLSIFHLNVKQNRAWLAKSFDFSIDFLFDLSLTVKALSSPRGGLFNFGHSRGGLIREGSLFKKLDEKDIYDSFISLLPHILQFQHTILRVEYIYLTEFYSQTVPKLTCKRSLSYIN